MTIDLHDRVPSDGIPSWTEGHGTGHLKKTVCLQRTVYLLRVDVPSLLWSVSLWI